MVMTANNSEIVANLAIFCIGLDFECFDFSQVGLCAEIALEVNPLEWPRPSYGMRRQSGAATALWLRVPAKTGGESRVVARRKPAGRSFQKKGHFVSDKVAGLRQRTFEILKMSSTIFQVLLGCAIDE
jgi:hypothetical protein